jgi:hypothetical protein
VREQNVVDDERVAFRKREESSNLVAGIDENRPAAPFASDEVAVLEERSDSLRFDYHAFLHG